MGTEEDFRINAKTVFQPEYVIGEQLEINFPTANGKTGYSRVTVKRKSSIAQRLHSFGKFLCSMHTLNSNWVIGIRIDKAQGQPRALLSSDCCPLLIATIGNMPDKANKKGAD